ncbi:hypothetical protein ACJJIQ_00040 (plasmid) [Microbulbifer sp. ANSA003]|uniref:hypothetical protein n=1 Tax=Microbulbifer sp. ANSA003 TaxID=3243360 RepID=UPI004043078D
MAEKQQEIAEITIQRSTKVKGEFVERGRVLAVGSQADITANDARYLLRNGKALPGKCTRTIDMATAEKKAAQVARTEKEAQQALDEEAREALAARAEEAEARALDAEKRAAEAEKRAAEAEKKAKK